MKKQTIRFKNKRKRDGLRKQHETMCVPKPASPPRNEYRKVHARENKLSDCHIAYPKVTSGNQ